MKRLFFSAVLLAGPCEAQTVTSVVPATGRAGTCVEIVGTGFTGVTSVLFGANASPAITVASSTHIIATAPAGSGKVTVEVSK